LSIAHLFISDIKQKDEGGLVGGIGISIAGGVLTAVLSIGIGVAPEP
jgi:hypothetical protein